MQSVYAFTSESSEQEKGHLHPQDQLSPPVIIVGTHRQSLGRTQVDQARKVKFLLYKSLSL